LTIEITSDGMRCYATLSEPEAPNGAKVDADYVRAALASRGVTVGLDDSAIGSVASGSEYGRRVCVARGVDYVESTNARVEYLFKDKAEGGGPSEVDGKVDFREMNKIITVKADEVLCRLVPADEGQAGVTVTNVRTAPGKPKGAVLPRGKNTAVSADGRELLAQKDGQVQMADGKVHIHPSFEVPKNVDYSTGNIYFNGNVRIRGDVLPGFKVIAEGDVEVDGLVQGAHIQAGGDITLRRGMNGAGKGELVCGGDVAAKFLENSDVYAVGSIRAEAIMNSKVSCGADILATAGKGLLVGGSIRASRMINARKIGSELSITTELEIGIDPKKKERVADLRQQAVTLEENLGKTRQIVATLQRQEDSGTISDSHKTILVRSRVSYDEMRLQLNEVRADLERLDEEMAAQSKGMVVKASDSIHPGVRVSINGINKSVNESLRSVSLFVSGGEMVLGPY